MSTQATDQDDGTPGTRHHACGVKATAKKPSFFKMRAQMLDKGRTTRARQDREHVGDAQWSTPPARERAEHPPHEDHPSSCCKAARATTDADGGHTDVGKHEGIMLPAGAYYWFEATSKERWYCADRVAG